jgi:2-polyprenyl-3-methyl-5-hydroxy-6-metoxy-1,4-benzoquinol methylase
VWENKTIERKALVSFRDPAGSLLAYEGRILRIVRESGQGDLAALLDSRVGCEWMESGRIASTRVLGGDEAYALLRDPQVGVPFEALGGQLIAEHERIAFPSFPYEWPPEMLQAAGLLTIDLARALLADGLGLKDGTPYNVLFRGPEPVFIDVLSIERRDSHDPTWLPYAQFVRTFLLPLLLNHHFGVPLSQTLTSRRDGVEPEEVYRWLKPWQRLLPPFMGLVSMPTWLGSRHNPDDTEVYRKKTKRNPEQARFILRALLNRLRRTLVRLTPKQGKTSVWSDYMVSNNNYSTEQFDAKQQFVERTVVEFQPRRVLDVGCNTGHFSAIAAARGAEVVAIDYDPVVAGSVWRQARERKLPILPLVVDLTRPTPGQGWRNREWTGFLERARGAFDCVFMLAVIHHMLVTERVPLPEIVDLAADLTSDLLIIEFIAPEDSMFRRLTRGREELHKDLTREVFEAACAQRFETVRSRHVEGSARWLYLMRKRSN